MIKEKHMIRIFLIVSIATFFFFGLRHLTKFVTADEHYWIYERVPQYWNALAKGDLAKTFINDKPGVTVALFSFPALLHEPHPENYVTAADKDLDRYDTEKMDDLLLAFRLPILVFCGLFLFYIFWIVGKISDPWIALWTTILAGLSPVILGMSQIINPDALLWAFSAAAIFSYIALLQHGQKRYLLLTVMFTGLGMLTKYSIDILFPFYLFLMVAFYFFNYRYLPDTRTFFRQNLRRFLFIAGGSSAIVVFFIPAVILKPVYLYRMTFGVKNTLVLWILIILVFLFLAIDTFALDSKIISACRKKFADYQKYLRLLSFLMLLIFLILIVGRMFFDSWTLFRDIPFDLKDIDGTATKKYSLNVFEKVILEFNPLVFSLTPVVLFLSLVAWISAVVRKKPRYAFFTTTITFFIFAYYLSFLAADVLATVRYSIIIYPLVAFLAAIGITELREKFNGSNALMFNAGISVILTILSIQALYSVKPFYFNYVSPLLPKNQTVADAWGFGGYEAAQYLAQLPDAKNLTVWADYYGVCEFFPGKCITDYRFNKEKYKVDYYVLTRRGRIKYRPFFNSRLGKYPDFSEAHRYYDRTDPLWELDINGRPENYIKIFRAD